MSLLRSRRSRFVAAAVLMALLVGTPVALAVTDDGGTSAAARERDIVERPQENVADESAAPSSAVPEVAPEPAAELAPDEVTPGAAGAPAAGRTRTGTVTETWEIVEIPAPGTEDRSCPYGIAPGHAPDSGVCFDPSLVPDPSQMPALDFEWKVDGEAIQERMRQEQEQWLQEELNRYASGGGNYDPSQNQVITP